MKEKEFHLRLPNNLFERLRDLSPTSINQFIIDAINHYLNCKAKEKKEADESSLRLIVTKFQGRCTKCGGLIPLASLAYYGKSEGRTILICMDCMVESKSDKALAARYVKMRELDKVIKALKREADNLSDKISELQTLKMIDDFLSRYIEIMNLLKEYILHCGGNEREKLEEIIAKLEDADKIKREAQAKIESLFKIRRGKNVK